MIKVNARKKLYLSLFCLLLTGGIIGFGLFAPEEAFVQEMQQDKTGARPIPVAVKKVTVEMFEDSLTIQGNLEAKNYALVSPRIPGVLEHVMVREGYTVVAGETPLFQTDSLKLEKAMDIAEKDLDVARFARQEKEAYAESIEADLEKAEADFHRYQKLYEQDVFTKSAFEEKETAFKRLSAMKRHAQSLVALAREQEKKAETAAAIAAKDLRDSLVLAPISGKVSRRMGEPGEMGSPGKPVIRIDDVTHLEACGFLPRQYYDRVCTDQTRVRIFHSDRPMEGVPVVYKSPTVDATLRTFEIKCDIKGNTEWAVPGVLLEMHVIFSREKGLAVPAASVVSRSGKKAVFLLDGEKARMKVVETGLETDGRVQVTGEGLSENSRVITQGQFLLNDGSPVLLQEETD